MQMDSYIFICESHPENEHTHDVRNSQDFWYSIRDTAAGKWADTIHLTTKGY